MKVIEGCPAIFGGCCLVWAILLTIFSIKEKGQFFVKGKEHQGYAITIGLYIVGIVLIII